MFAERVMYAEGVVIYTAKAVMIYSLRLMIYTPRASDVRRGRVMYAEGVMGNEGRLGEVRRLIVEVAICGAMW